MSGCRRWGTMTHFSFIPVTVPSLSLLQDLPFPSMISRAHLVRGKKVYPFCLKLHPPFFSFFSSGPGTSSWQRHILISSSPLLFEVLLLVILDRTEEGTDRHISDLSGQCHGLGLVLWLLQPSLTPTGPPIADGLMKCRCGFFGGGCDER